MSELYYYLVFLNAAVSLAVAAAVFWKNRYRAVGPLFCTAMVILAVWMVGFAQYFRPMEGNVALVWAKVTLSSSILIHPFLFHSMCAFVVKMRRFRWWIAALYSIAAVFLILLWHGVLVTGLKPTPYMDHYISYNRGWYSILGSYIVFSQLFGLGILAYNAWQSTGYKQTQLIYFIVAWFIVSLVTNSIALPLEYDINIQPFGFWVLPLNLALLAYVMAKARLADFNVVISQILLYAVTLVVVVGMNLLLITAVTYAEPGFLNPQQIFLLAVMVFLSNLALTVALPQFLPRAERLLQKGLFGSRYEYQDAVAGLVKDLSRMPNIDQLLNTVATTVHSQMQVERVLILVQNPLSGNYELKAESGLSPEEISDTLELGENSAIVQWLRGTKDALVRDELPRRVDEQTLRSLEAELDRLKASVCVSMTLNEKLMGILCFGEKASKEMFFASDLRVLETLATEVALAVRYRRMEDEIVRQNKLAELGTIAAGVAHEIRNPLSSIRTFAQLLPEQKDDPEFQGKFSELVIKDVDRITKVIETMLAFARPPKVTIGEHSTTELVEGAVLFAQLGLKKKSIELTKEFHEQSVVKVDKQQIQQVLINLLNNAVDALPEHGKIQVSTGVQIMEDVNQGNKRRKFAVIEVADNGPGIPDAVRNRLFDPFFTTKHEGTGLGLSISQKIVRDHGGTITVSSIEGKGATFQVNLPLG